MESMRIYLTENGVGRATTGVFHKHSQQETPYWDPNPCLRRRMDLSIIYELSLCDVESPLRAGGSREILLRMTSSARRCCGVERRFTGTMSQGRDNGPLHRSCCFPANLLRYASCVEWLCCLFCGGRGKSAVPEVKRLGT